MLCPRCHGAHVILVNELPVPCPECQGMGEVHCCDGLREQPIEDGLWADDETTQPARPAPERHLWQMNNDPNKERRNTGKE